MDAGLSDEHFRFDVKELVKEHEAGASNIPEIPSAAAIAIDALLAPAAGTKAETGEPDPEIAAEEEPVVAAVSPEQVLTGMLDPKGVGKLKFMNIAKARQTATQLLVSTL